MSRHKTAKVGNAWQNQVTFKKCFVNLVEFKDAELIQLPTK